MKLLIVSAVLSLSAGVVILPVLLSGIVVLPVILLSGVCILTAVGLTADQLAQIRAMYRTVPYCDAAQAYADEQADEIAAKLRTFVGQYDGWRLTAGG